MFNVGGGEVLVILLVALLVVGPGKLPEAARQIGNVLTQVRKMSTGFQNELRSALEAPPEPKVTETAAVDQAATADAANASDTPDDSPGTATIATTADASPDNADGTAPDPAALLDDTDDSDDD